MNSFYEHHRDSIHWHYRCFDRILVNGLIQPFQQPERVVGFFNTYRAVAEPQLRLAKAKIKVRQSSIFRFLRHAKMTFKKGCMPSRKSSSEGAARQLENYHLHRYAAP